MEVKAKIDIVTPSRSPEKLHIPPRFSQLCHFYFWHQHLQKSIWDCISLQLLWNSEYSISAFNVLSVPCIKIISNKSSSFISTPYCSVEHFLPYAIVFSLSLHPLQPYFLLLFILCILWCLHCLGFDFIFV